MSVKAILTEVSVGTDRRQIRQRFIHARDSGTAVVTGFVRNWVRRCVCNWFLHVQRTWCAILCPSGSSVYTSRIIAKNKK